MRAQVTLGFIALSLSVAALPTSLDEFSRADLVRRQDIDFDLVDETPDPVIAPDNSTNYNQKDAVAVVKLDIIEDPLRQDASTAKVRRDIITTTSPGYTFNIPLTGAALSAPLNCNGADTFLGAKLFTGGTFDTNLCATACSAQSAYNLAHPPLTGRPKTCQFYNTYVMYKNNVYQGQYCAMYTQAWDTSYATNKGQWRGQDHYTIDQSFIASNATNSGDVSCPSDISYLSANGADFCTAYINYSPTVSTVNSVVTPATLVVASTATELTTVTIYGTETQTDLKTITLTANRKRALQTPASISTWSPSRISKACSSVATGKTIITATQTVATPYSTSVTTQIQTQTSTVSITTVTSLTSTVIQVAAAPSNHVSNGGWELGRYPWQYYGDAENIRDQVPDAYQGEVFGSSSLYVDDPTQDYGSSSFSQAITGLSAARFYTLKFSYRVISNHGCSLDVYLNQDHVFIDPVAVVRSDYITKTVEGIQVQSGNVNFQIAYICSGQGQVYIDDVSLVG
ncbi:hypothetical protein VTO58DRAFT_103928 [Aureobasidium pullulans]